MVNKTRFDLEQEILDCWTITTAIDDVFTAINDDPFFEGLDPRHQDRLSNLMLGIFTLYELKFDRTFKTFESVVRNGALK